MKIKENIKEIRLSIPNFEYERIIEYEGYEKLLRNIKKIVEVGVNHYKHNPTQNVEKKYATMKIEAIQDVKGTLKMLKGTGEEKIRPFQMGVLMEETNKHIIITKEKDLERAYEWHKQRNPTEMMVVMVKHHAIKGVMQSILKKDPFEQKKDERRNLKTLLKIEPLQELLRKKVRDMEKQKDVIEHVPCNTCYRTFASNRIGKHRDICNKKNKQRGVFNTTEKRVPREALLKRKQKVEKTTKSTWKKQHEELIKYVRFAKEAKHLKKCRHCERTFAATRLRKHTNVCKQKKPRIVFDSKKQRLPVEAAVDIQTYYKMETKRATERTPCQHCSRLFFPKSHERHERICGEKRKERVVFDSRQQRMRDMPKYKRRVRTNLRQHQHDWRQHHQGWMKFLNTHRHHVEAIEEQCQKRYGAQLTMLKDMGFANNVNTKKLLLKYKGNIRKVLESLFHQ